MELFDFQKEDVTKLSKQNAAFIGSEMGTGKTHEAIALIMEWMDFHNSYPVLNRRKPSLVVAPLNTHKSWVEKFELQASHIRVKRIDRKDRDDFIFSILNDDADVYLMHWQALVKMSWLNKFEYGVIVGDEVHRISNREAKTTKAFKLLKAEYKLGMSGTMSGDKPDKLWSVLNWAYPKQFSSYWHFREDFILEDVGYSGYRQIIGVKNTDELAKKISPFFVRHLKKERCCENHPNGVMDYLPSKTYNRVYVQLGAKQRRLYNQMQDSMVAWLGEHEDEAFAASAVIAQLTRLSQMALATPKLEPKVVRRRNPMHEIDDSELEFIEEVQISVILESPSTKIDAVQEILEDNPDKSFVVFSSSKQAINLAKTQLESAGISCEVLTGDTPQYRRDWMIDAFQRGEFRVFLGVIAACGEGIDGLQNVCDTVIFMDRSWTSYENKQAEDRLHRQGQKSNVQVIDIVAEDTVDEYRHSRISQKWRWLKQIVGDIPEIEADLETAA